MYSLGSRHCSYVATLSRLMGGSRYIIVCMYTIALVYVLWSLFALQVPAPLTPLQEKLLQGVLQLKDEVKLGLISCSLINCLLKTPQ